MATRKLPLSAVLVTCLLAAGCGGGSDDAVAAPADVDAAQAVVSEAMQNPEGLGYDLPLNKPVTDGMKVGALVSPVAVMEVTTRYRQEALDMLGWELSRVTVGSGPEAPAEALDQALDTNPDVATFAGFDPSTVSAQLQRAQDAGIPIIGESIPIETPAIVANVRGLASNDRIAEMSAAFVVADSGGKANIEFFNVPSQPILTTYYDSFEKYLKKWCPGCKVHLNNFEFTDIGSALPDQVVSALQRNPDANYTLFGLGDATVGVEAALAGAGLTDQTKIGGAIPSLENYEALRSGTNAFWAADSSPVLAWKQTDLMIRALMGEDLKEAEDAPIIAQLLTPENVDDAVFDDDGYWLGYGDYSKDYAAMWGK